MLFVLMLGLSSCNRNDKPSLKQEPNEAITKLAFSFESDNGSVSTKSSVATSAERQINKLGIMFYSETGVYVANAIATISDGSGAQAGTATFTMPTDIRDNAGTYNMLVFTNGSVSFENSENDLQKFMNNKISNNHSEMRGVLHVESDEQISAPHLAYSGEGNFISTGNSANTISLSVTLKRNVAKFELLNKATNKLYIEWVKVSNYRSQGYLFQDGIPPFSKVITGVAGQNNAVTPTVLDVGSQYQQQVSSGLYAFPNLVPYTAQNDKYTTCFIIAARYKADGWGATKPSDSALSAVSITYYRANIHSKIGDSQILNINSRYKVTITGANGCRY